MHVSEKKSADFCDWELGTGLYPVLALRSVPCVSYHSRTCFLVIPVSRHRNLLFNMRDYPVKPDNDNFRLFIIVMILALIDFYAVSVNFVDKAVLFVNLAAPPAGKISLQRFWMTKPCRCVRCRQVVWIFFSASFYPDSASIQSAPKPNRRIPSSFSHPVDFLK